VGIPTGQNPDTPEGLKSRLSIGIHRIPAGLQHLTDRELGKPHRTRMDSAEHMRSSYSEDSREVGKSSGPQNLASLSTLQRMNLGL
jgi:hypothetical protein